MSTQTQLKTAFVTLATGLAVLATGCRPAAPTVAPSPTAAQPTLAPATETAAPTETPLPAPTATATAEATVTTMPQADVVTSTADLIAGQWEGAIDVAGQHIGIITRFSVTDGQLKGVLDIPQQAAKDLPLNNIKLEAPRIYFEMLSGANMASYDGEVQPDGATITGTFKQSGYEGTFELKRVEVVATPPPPYQVEEVTFTHDQAKLAGTLTLPQGDGPFPAVVLISGSGAQNRNEDIFGFQIFGVIADHLTRNGIAVLRYDDRGIGGSTGDFANATSEDFAGDVAAAVELLKTKPAIDPNKVGLFGHSEGGIIAPLVISNTPGVAFAVLMAGTGVSGADVIREQVAAILKANGATDAQIKEAMDQQARMIEAVRTGEGWEELEANWRKQTQDAIDAMTDEQRNQIDDVDQYVENAVKGLRQSVDNPWFRFFLFHDPAQALRRVNVPVLALFGEKDLQVLAKTNEPAVSNALKEAGNTDVTVKTFPGANHLFQLAKTGSSAEYATLPKEFVPGFLDTITEWILAHTK